MSNMGSLVQAAHDIKQKIDDVLLRASVLDSGESRVAAMLCLTIAEQFEAALKLVESGFSSHAPIIVRSMLEGFANLLNVVKDRAYVDQLRFENARSDVILFTAYAADASMQGETEALAKLAQWKAQAEPVCDDLKKRGFRELKVLDKFKKAGILQNYVAYRVFCSFGHNQLTTLLARHAGDFELRYHYEAPDEMTESLLTVAVSILCRAVVTAAHYTDLTDDELKRMPDAADATWGAARTVS